MPPPNSIFKRVRNKLSACIVEILSSKFVLREEYERLNQEIQSKSSRIDLNRWNEIHRLELLRTVPNAYLQFDYHIVEHCNLNCIGCNHFAPLAEKECIDVDIFEKDMRRVAELTSGNSKYIHIIGGEPTLHPQLLKINKIARKYFSESKIALFTNGTLLLNQNDFFWNNMKDNKIDILASHYPGVDYEGIKNKAHKYNINFEYFMNWEKENARTMNSKEVLDIRGTQDYKRNFIYCERGNICSTLRNGKLYTCPTIATIYHFNKYFNQQLEVTEMDYIDIYKARDINEILSFLSRPAPFCRYCNILSRRSKHLSIPFQESKKDIVEWI